MPANLGGAGPDSGWSPGAVVEPTPPLNRRAGGWVVAVAAFLLLAGVVLLLDGTRKFTSESQRAEPSESAIAEAVAPEPSATKRPYPSATREPTATEPILPPRPTVTVASNPPLTVGTPLPTPLATHPTATSSPIAGSSPSALPLPQATSLVHPGLYSPRQRLGVCASARGVSDTLADQLGFGWYLDWAVRPDGFRSSEVEYMPMIRLRSGEPYPGVEGLPEAVQALPGALWLIGNEPDVRWQDNVTPEVYARAYHDLYTELKALDPTCLVAIGGVSQPTPLRLDYLDRILEAYQSEYGASMPVDVWNVHNFILREERSSWGVDIPPGMHEDTGQLREIADHDDLAIFRQQIVGFRRWMKERGQQEKRLIVTEYGILMPAEYGFPPAAVERFMLATFDYLQSAADVDLGLPEDGYRLVQRWSWFSLADDRYPSGNLLAPDGSLSPLGEAFLRYAGQTR